MKKTVPSQTDDTAAMFAAAPATIGAAIRWGREQLAASSSSPAIDARALLLDCLHYNEYAQLLAHENDALPSSAATRYQQHIRKRAAGEPVAYILGWREFYSRRFKTTAAALIPRPDTELLVESALQHLPASTVARVLDLGAGCGAIGISIALARENSHVTLTDVSEPTLALARENAAMHKANVSFVCGDWYTPLSCANSDETSHQFDLIVSNPPYIAQDDAHLTSGDLRFEPSLALVAGADGLAALAPIIRQAPQNLRRGGTLLVEHGNTQAAAVHQLFAAAGFCGTRTLCDMGKQPRVTLAVLP